jgi:hypothetical protein
VSPTDTSADSAPSDGPQREAEAPGGEAAADETASSPLLLPPDPEAYDAERNVAARARGLAAPYIPGGRDPEPDAGLQEERKYTRLLLIMVAVIIVGGFVLGIIANIYTAVSGN